MYMVFNLIIAQDVRSVRNKVTKLVQSSACYY